MLRTFVVRLTQDQVEQLNMLGYFKHPCTADFVCGLVGCKSKVRPTADGFLFVTSATNTVSVTPKPSFDSLVDYVLDYQYKNAPYEYFERVDSSNSVSSLAVMCSQYVFAKSKKGSSRDATRNLVRVKSSNVWSYGLDIQLGQNTGDLYVQFKNPSGGPGDVYQYFDFPVKVWKKFITAPSKGHFFWKYVRNNYRYRKLTGDKRGKLPNAIN